MVASLSGFVALHMSKERMFGSLLSYELTIPSTAFAAPCYLQGGYSQSVATTHAICMVSSLPEKTALVGKETAYGSLGREFFP